MSKGSSVGREGSEVGPGLMAQGSVALMMLLSGGAHPRYQLQ